MTAPSPNKTAVSNSQRALWVFLGYTLVGPFFAAMTIVAALLVFPVLKLDPFLPALSVSIGEVGVRSYVWSAFPAAFAGIAAAAVVFKTGTFSNFTAAAAGVVAFAIAAIVFAFDLPNFLTALAILAGLVSLAVRYALLSGGLIEDDDE